MSMKTFHKDSDFTKKLCIPDTKMDINLRFYYILKHLVKAQLTDNQVINFCSCFDSNNNLSRKKQIISDCIDDIKAEKKRQELHGILDLLLTEQDFVLFEFGLGLYFIKNLLLKEANVHRLNKQHILSSIHLLSLEYDKTTLVTPYTTRVYGALLALLFFEKIELPDLHFLTAEPFLLLEKMSKQAIQLKKQSLNSNQMFMLMFSQSLNQSITSNSGVDYEKRIKKVLVDVGVPSESITKEHDANDKSTEFDFFFTLNNKTIGIGAKRTLRERYKQFIKTAHTSQLDVMICITLGVDATEEKVHTICNQHEVILFVSDEVYQEREFLQNEPNCYSVNEFTLETLERLASEA